MAVKGSVRTMLISVAILIVGIIHFGVGIGIVAKYKKFGDTFQQEVGLSGYNIFIGIFTIITSIIGIVAVIKDHTLLTKVAALLSFVLGIFVLASLITALALSGQAASYLHDSLTDNMNNYIQDQDSIDTINTLQTYYGCCGVNLWLDWSRVPLTAYGMTNGRRRRRREAISTTTEAESPLVRSIKQERDVRDSLFYNLPSDYNVILPISCCRSGGTSAGGNSLGAYCLFNSYNTTESFYVSGCLEPVSNRAFSQIAGIIVINTCLLILAFVNFGKLITIFKKEKQTNKEMIKQYDPNQVQSIEQQYQNNQYYIDDYYNQYPNNNYNYTNSNPNYNYQYQYSNEDYNNQMRSLYL